MPKQRIIRPFSGNSVEVTADALSPIVNSLFPELKWNARRNFQEIHRKGKDDKPYTYKYLTIKPTTNYNNPKTTYQYSAEKRTNYQYEVSVTPEHTNDLKSLLERLKIPEQ